MPNPMPDPDGGPPVWYWRLTCGDAVTSTNENGYQSGQPFECPVHIDQGVTVDRKETYEEVDARNVPAPTE